MGSKDKVFRLRLDNAPVNELRGGRGLTTSLIGPATSGTNSIDLHLNVLRPNTGPGPRHFHERAENIYWVLEGSIRVTLADEVIVLEEDELVLIPPGVVHETSNPGTKVARFIEIYIPAGEDFHIVDSFQQ